MRFTRLNKSIDCYIEIYVMESFRYAIGDCSFDYGFFLNASSGSIESRNFDGFRVGIVAACRGPMDFRMVRERAYDEGGTKRGC